MARKHDRFSYSYGWRTAPEQWHFGWNGKPIRLDNETRSFIANLMIAGNNEAAEAVLKRMLRKQEREDSYYVTIGFHGEGNNQFYFTKQLFCKVNNLQEKLQIYKEWKRYILSKDCILSTHTVTSGYVTPDGVTAGKEEEIQERVDISRPVTIRLFRPQEEMVFQY